MNIIPQEGRRYTRISKFEKSVPYLLPCIFRTADIYLEKSHCRSLSDEKAYIKVS